jgi:hypothetical protein
MADLTILRFVFVFQKDGAPYLFGGRWFFETILSSLARLLIFVLYIGISRVYVLLL